MKARDIGTNLENWISTRFQTFFNRFIPLILIGYEFSDLDVFYNHESYRYLDLGNEFDLGEDSFTVAAMIRLRPDPESSANFTNRGARHRFKLFRSKDTTFGRLEFTQKDVAVGTFEPSVEVDEGQLSKIQYYDGWSNNRTSF